MRDNSKLEIQNSKFMKFLVFTSPSFIPDEAFYIRRMFELGLDALHLRKPGASAEECARLIEEIPRQWRGRVVVHDHFRLCRDYGLMGVHLNSRNPAPPADFRPGTVSASCHSLAEVARRKTSLSYVTLSPVFDSISKQGYRAAFPAEELERAAAAGVIDGRVVALGGVSLGNIPRLREWHFGGAAMLGGVWSRAGKPGFDDYVSALRRALDD